MSSYDCEEVGELVDLQGAASVFGYGGSHNPDVEFEKVGDLVHAIYEIGVEHDDESDSYQQLRCDLPDEFKELEMDDLLKPEVQEEYAENIELLLEVAEDVRDLAGLSRPDNAY